MKKCLALLSILFFSTAYAQNVTLSGYIKDAANGEELINASIVNEKLSRDCHQRLWLLLLNPPGRKIHLYGKLHRV